MEMLMQVAAKRNEGTRPQCREKSSKTNGPAGEQPIEQRRRSGLRARADGSIGRSVGHTTPGTGTGPLSAMSSCKGCSGARCSSECSRSGTSRRGCCPPVCASRRTKPETEEQSRSERVGWMVRSRRSSTARKHARHARWYESAREKAASKGRPGSGAAAAAASAPTAAGTTAVHAQRKEAAVSD